MNKLSKRDILETLRQKRLQLIGTEVISVLDSSSFVDVRIDGLVYRLAVSNVPKGFSDVAVIRVLHDSIAEYIRAADTVERSKYFSMFPSTEMIIVDEENNHWFGYQAHGSQSIKIDGVATIKFVQHRVELFDTVVCRFDGRQLMFDDISQVADPSIAVYLRQSFFDNVLDASSLRYVGLSSFQRNAYALKVAHLLEQEKQLELEERRKRLRTIEGRIQNAVEFSGGELEGFTNGWGGDTYRVSYRVDGRLFTSEILQSNLQVISSGVCLAGRDRDFDLTTVVGVLRSGMKKGEI